MVRCAHMTVCVHLMASLIAYLSSPDKESKNHQKLDTALLVPKEIAHRYIDAVYSYYCLTRFCPKTF